MTNKATKYGLMTIAAVLLVALAFAGAGAAMGGNPVLLTDSSYKVLVVDDVSGKVAATSGTTLGSSVYLLEDTADWNAVAIDDSYNGAVLIIGDNLNFSGTANDCMITYPFAGKIYGNGYLLENFTNTTFSSANAGLIREAGNGLYLNYVQMSNCSYGISGGNAYYSVGALIGNIDGASSTNKVSVIGCSIFGADIYGLSGVGGLIGFVQGESAQLTLNHSNVHNLSLKGAGHSLGGLIGRLGFNGDSERLSDPCVVFNCTVTDSWLESGTSAGSTGVMGGLTGFAYGPNTSIKDCKVTNCTIKAKAHSLGGLIGNAKEGVSIEDCDAINCNVIISGVLGTGRSSGYVGGLIGRAGNSNPITVKYCDSINCNISGDDNTYGIGGIIGGSDNPNLSVDNCRALGCNIIGLEVSKTGGIVGSGQCTGSTNGTFTNCIAGTTDVPIYLYPHAGNDLNATGVLATMTGCSAKITGTPIDLQFPTKEEIQVFPASKLPYVYVTYNAKEGYIGSPYSESKKSVAMPYVRSEIFDQSKVTPIRGGYAFTTWCLENTATTRPETAVVNNEVVTPGWVYSKTTVNYHNISSETFPVVYTYDNSADVPTPVRTGYTFNAWNLSSESGYPFSGNTTYFKDSKWNYTGPDGGTLDVYANWTADEYNKSVPSSGIVEFGNGLPVVRVIVGSANPNITNVSFEFMGAPADIATKPSGYKSIATIYDAFNLSINGTQDADVTVIFNATGSDTIFLAHNNSGNWEFLKATATDVAGQYEALVTKASGFSPFQIISAVANDPVYTSSSSHSTGSTQILSEGQIAPTAYATATPTVAPTVKPTEQPVTPTVIATEKPTTQATQQSPAPFVGLLAGLGAAAVLLRLRK